MYQNERDSNGSSQIGERGENLFIASASKRGWAITPANRHEQIVEHWDYKIENGSGKDLKVEVKAMKRRTRWGGNVQDKDIWIEFKNVGGDDGWLYGCADCLAFQCMEGFIMVNRKRLAKLCENLIGMTKDEITHEIASTRIEHYKLYSRRDRKDVLTIIKKEDLLKINHELLSY